MDLNAELALKGADDHLWQKVPLGGPLKVLCGPLLLMLGTSLALQDTSWIFLGSF